MSDLSRDPYEEAKELGLVAVLPEECELFLDIDNKDDFEVMTEIIKVLRHNHFKIAEEKVTRSKSKKWHVYLRTELPLDAMTRIALQACLGSDRKREALSILRHLHGNFAPTVFFEKPS